MLSLNRIKKGLRNPQLILRELNRLYYTQGSRDHNPKGINVFEEDWDNLIVLDACRYELFENIALKGELESKISKGASTIEFLRGNFRGKKLNDTVYVTANPHFSGREEKLDTEVHDLINVWGGEDWNSMVDTVMPDTVSDEAISASEKHGDKRLMVHYMQPHYPFVSEEEEVETPTGIDHIWHRVMAGELDLEPEAVWSDYRKTFEFVMEEVERLVEHLDGKTVVTADHGNVYSERVSPIPVKEWGHPIGIYDRKLVKVPWLIIDGERREIKASGKENRETAEENDEEIKEKLSKLGYK